MLGLDQWQHPGRVFALAAVLPLAAFVLLLALGYLRRLAIATRGEFLLSRLVLRLTGERPNRLGGVLALLPMVAACALSVEGLVQAVREYRADAGIPALLEARWHESVDWVRLGSSEPGVALTFGYRVDILAALLFTMVTFVGSWIFLFSVGYMADEAAAMVTDHEAHATRRGRFGRFFLYLSLFAFAMLHLLIADNLLQVFVSWELVGVCSFFLVGFYSERRSAAVAANKAFIVNRIGDAGFLVGIAALWAQFGTLDIRALSASLSADPALRESALMTVAGLGVFLGCAGKSAQFPLHTWLPDAMEGPTPVSALIHAATMVAAGVYLAARCADLFSGQALVVIAYTGAVTAFLAATIATVQTDIKRVLAYSTVSQLGLMVLAVGVGGWVGAVLHLVTHAFFKALLFLGSGSVIHGVHHEQDVRHMGGLRRRMPVTAVTMLIGVLAIAGFPLFSGWYSKDTILADALGYVTLHPRHAALYWLPVLTAVLTAFYMARLWLLTFAGEPRSESATHAHESPATMTLPLVVLAAGSVGVAWGWPLWDAEASFLGRLLASAVPTAFAERFHAEAEAAHSKHLAAGVTALIAAAVGAAAGVSRYGAGFRPTLLRAGRSPVQRLLRHRWYFDELYDWSIVRPVVALARLVGRADRATGREPAPGDRTVDGVVALPALAAQGAGRVARAAQSGRLRVYVLALALTAAVALAMLAALARPA